MISRLHVCSIMSSSTCGLCDKFSTPTFTTTKKVIFGAITEITFLAISFVLGRLTSIAYSLLSPFWIYFLENRKSVCQLLAPSVFSLSLFIIFCFSDFPPILVCSLVETGAHQRNRFPSSELPLTLCDHCRG